MLLADYAAYYTTVEALITTNQQQNVDFAGDVAQSFCNGFASNGYALVGSLISQGFVQAYLQVSSNIYLDAIFSLENLNAILPYCGDTTYDAVASIIGSMVGAFITQVCSARSFFPPLNTFESLLIDSSEFSNVWWDWVSVTPWIHASLSCHFCATGIYIADNTS